MDYRIKITREGDKFEVCVTDPEIVKANTSPKARWQDPENEYTFDSWEQVSTFLDKIADKALPVTEYNRAFAQAAKEAANGK